MTAEDLGPPKLAKAASLGLVVSPQKPLLPAMTDNILRHKNGTSQNDGIEICKQSVAMLVGDIRAEVQQAAAILRSEVASSGSARMGPVQVKLMHVADNLQNAEKDAMGRLKDLMKSTNWELGQRLDQQMSVNAQLGGQLQSSWEKILAVVNRLEVTTNSLEGRMRESETKVDTWCTKVTDSLQGIFANIAEESKNIQEQCSRQIDAVQDTLVRQEVRSQRELQSSCDALAERVDKVAAKSKEQTTDVKEGQTRIQGSIEAVSREILGLQVQDEQNHNALKSSMDAQMSSHKNQLFELKTEVETFFEPVLQDCSAILKQNDKSTRSILYEVGRIQKELRVDYVKLKDQTKEPGAVADDIDGKASLRCRDYFAQTESAAVKENTMQTDPVQFENGGHKKAKKKKEPTKQEEAKSKIHKAAFSGADQLKAQATAAAMKKQYNVFDYYHEEGVIQRIAKNKWFETITLSVITLNALYLSIDTDNNNASTIVDASPVFQFSEIAFFVYFSCELAIRFLAFKIKRNCLRDAWFVFDSSLVFIMTCETVILPIILIVTDSEGGLPGGTSALRMLRLLRLLRLSRLTKLLRALPELVIIMKGVAFAARSVTIFFVLWIMIAYVFAIMFRNLPGLEDHDVAKKFFPSVSEAMNNMLLYGVFNSNALVVKEIAADVPWLWPFMVFFLALVSLTIMYMLVGVLVDVISVVATTEKEKLGMTYIVELLREELDKLGLKEDLKINQAEFQNLILEPGIIRVLQEAGVDVAVLADMLDVVFEDVAHKGEEGKGAMMTFSDLVTMLLSMRGANPATVKDCKEQIRVTKTIIRQSMEEINENLNEMFTKLRNDIQSIDAVDDDDE